MLHSGKPKRGKCRQRSRSESFDNEPSVNMNDSDSGSTVKE